MRYDVVSSIKQVDLSSLTWYKDSTSYGCFYAIPPLPGYKLNTPVYCQGYSWHATGPVQLQELEISTVTFFFQRNVYIKDSRYKTPAEFKQAMQGHILTYVTTDAPRRFDIIKQDYTINVKDYTIYFNAQAPSASFYIPGTSLNPKAKKNTNNKQLIVSDPDKVMGLSSSYQDNNGNLILYTRKAYNTSVEAKAAMSNVKLTYTTENQTRFTFVNDTAQIDLGACTWTKENNSGGYYTTSITDIKKRGGSTGWNSNLFIDGYTNQRVATFPVLDMSFNGTSTHDWRQFNIHNNQAAGMTPAEFKSFISGTILTYESTQKETKV